VFQQILIYWLIAQLLGLAGLPLARLVLGSLPERGYPFSKALGLLLSGYLAWLLAMLGFAPYGAPLVVVMVLVIAVLGMLAHPAGHPIAILAWLRERWRTILCYELVFVLALVYLATQRSYEWGFVGPQPWGTERPMDFAFFNAIQRSAAFPPHDPWMAGYSINYYYFGYLLMASVALISGQLPGVTYNLSLALIFALTAQGIAGLVVALVALTRRNSASAASDSGELPATPQRTGIAAWLVVALAVVTILFAGNQAGALQVLAGSNAVSTLNASDLGRVVANGIGPRTPVTLSQPYPNELIQDGTVITPTDRLKDFDWWWPSRALWDWVPGTPPGQIYAITEFPFFSFWLGDMHPHLMALPFSLLAMAFALQMVARPDMPAYGRSRQGWIELIATGVVLGALYVINSWDFPTYLLLFLAALLLRHARSTNDTHDSRPGALGIGWRAYGVQALMIVFAALALFLPFHLTFRSLVGAKAPLIDIPILATITKTIGVVGWPKTPLHTFLIIFGLFLSPILLWVGSIALRGRSWNAPWLITSAILAVGLAIGFPLIALLPLAFYTLRAALAHSRIGEVAVSFALVAFGLTCLIGFGTEIIYIRDVFENRMNTIFKFYYQIWLILGVLSGYMLWSLYTAAQRTPLIGRIITGALFVPLLAGALLYPALTLSKLYSAGRQVGLDGTTPRDRTPDGAAAIEWLREHAAGDAVIIESVEKGPVYGYDTAGLGTSGVSASTGLATVMGWTGHQQQWRGGDAATFAQIEPRRADVEQIYTTPDPNQARLLLQKYGVRYIYVGGTERASYPADGLAKFDQIGTPVFQQGDITIYQVGK